ncbi:MAG: DUF4105 domain-containing protein [Thermodesulfobacteriota bacterium]|nr:DUF4105 domain-containing protein [Thermodesulfobacteriota bacterium]
MGLIVSLMALLMPVRSGFCRSGPVYRDVDRLVETAVAQNLHSREYWHILLHYEKALSGVKSQVDDPDFFLAPKGNTDSRAEMAATIRALFQPDDAAAAPFVCRFYARFQWLKSNLDADMTVYDHRVCEEIDRIVPRYASLVFPTYYMNNPASMFGHTLIAINTEYSSKRLAYAVNYAARADNVNGLSFAINGIFGLYKGYYSVDPYYKKIEEYSDIHQRDIWEYRLNLTPEEIQRLIWHVKEFKGIYTDYFFFDENCSYNLLYLLEAARPSLDLVQPFQGLWVLPADTVRAMRDQGLIESKTYRPSKASRIRHKIEALDPAAVDTALSVIEGEKSPDAVLNTEMPADSKIRILDLVSDQLQYLYVKRELEKTVYRQRFLAALKARSTLQREAVDYDREIEEPADPVSGHAFNRISVGGGVHEGDGFFEMRYRPAFTDLVDMDYMSNQGAKIEFGDARLRYYPEQGSFRLHQLDIIDIVSVSARDAFFKPLSWKFDTGFHRKLMDNGDASLYYRLNTGTGVAVESTVWGLSYAMIEGELDMTGALEESYALGGGATLGIIKALTPFWKLHAYANPKWFFAGDDHQAHEAGMVNNFRIANNHQVSVELTWSKTREWDKTDVQAVWHWYF